MSTPPIFTPAASAQPQQPNDSQTHAQGARPHKRIQRVEDSTVDPTPITQMTRRIRTVSPSRDKIDCREIINQMNNLVVDDCGQSDSDDDKPTNFVVL